MTLKLNITDIVRVIKDLERHEYSIKASFKEKDTDSDFKDRYESLMRFLNP